MTGAIGTVVGDTVSIVANPGQWVSTFTTSAINYVATDMLTGLVNSLPNGGNPPTIMSTLQMSHKQLKAYNGWLSSPAVLAETMNVGSDVAWGQGYWDYTGQENTTPQ